MAEAIKLRERVKIALVLGALLSQSLTKADAAKAHEAILRLMGHIEALEDLLDETDQEDFFGSEGWRRRLGIDQ